MKAEELLSRYAAGERDFRDANLGSADLAGAHLTGANLGSANLTGAYLTGAYLRGANLGSAYLRGANLGSANLGSANLGSANLGSADLAGAHLTGANLGEDQWVIQGPTRSDGHAFFLMRLKDEKEPMVRASCRWFTLTDAKTHWETTRGGTQLGNESLDILIWLERAMNLRGLS